MTTTTFLPLSMACLLTQKRTEPDSAAWRRAGAQPRPSVVAANPIDEPSNAPLERHRPDRPGAPVLGLDHDFFQARGIELVAHARAETRAGCLEVAGQLAERDRDVGVSVLLGVA